MYYFVKPKDSGSSSMRWYVDSPGLDVVKHRYTFYGRDPLNIVNRWDEFEVSETKEIPIDFGGMLCLTEPEVFIRDGDIASFKMKVSHLPSFIHALQNITDSEKCKGICSFSMRWWNLCLGLETANKILLQAIDLQLNCEEMIEGVAKKREED